MKFLFDQNLSKKLVSAVSSHCPGSKHVSDVGLDKATDAEIWDYARTNDFIIVTQDSDFQDLAVFFGHPPYVVWIRIGNAPTAAIQSTLVSNIQAIGRLMTDKAIGVIELTGNA
jgi:predicted nuclease of predicted toxin-antitoxin system